MNAAGGLEGHHIDLVFSDDGGTPGTSVSDVQQMLSEHVTAIVDNSIADETWQSAVSAAGVPVVGTNVSEGPFYTNSDFYPQGQTGDSEISAVVATAKTAGATNLSTVYCAEAASCQELLALTKTAGQAIGVPVVSSEVISATAPNYTAQCLAAEQEHVTALAVFDNGPVAAKFGASCAQQNYKPIYVTEGEGFVPLLLTTNGIKDNLWSEYPDLPYWVNNAATKAMDSALDKYYPGLTSNASVWGEYAALAWPSGLLLADAVKAGGLTPQGTPSPAEVVKGLQSLHGDTLDGWSPPLTFAPGKAHPVHCWFTAHVQNGVPQLSNGGKATCASTPSS